MNFFLISFLDKNTTCYLLSRITAYSNSIAVNISNILCPSLYKLDSAIESAATLSSISLSALVIRLYRASKQIKSFRILFLRRYSANFFIYMLQLIAFN
jgi:hypothetical protein